MLQACKKNPLLFQNAHDLNPTLPLHASRFASGPVWDVAFGPAGYYFATAAADRTACLWSTDCASPLRIFAGHLKGVLCVA